jgi:hypothetical protein
MKLKAHTYARLGDIFTAIGLQASAALTANAEARRILDARADALYTGKLERGFAESIADE